MYWRLSGAVEHHRTLLGEALSVSGLPDETEDPVQVVRV